MKNIFDSWTKSTKIAITSIVLVLMAAIAGYVTMSVSANTTAPQRITMAVDGRRVNAYITDLTFTIKKVTTGQYAYCVEYPKWSPSGTTMILEGERDAGYAYFLENGYPKKSITGDEAKDYYITQTAIWWYMDDTAGTKYLPNEFKTAADPHGLRPHIIRLANGAKAAKASGYATPAINVTVPGYTFSYSGAKATYYSSPIKVAGVKVEGRYSVTLSGVAGAYVTDVNGVAKTAFLPGESFKVAVPYGKANELNNKITVTIRATGKVLKAYSYKPEYNQNLQRMLPFMGITQSFNLVKSVDLTLSTSKLTVYKKDSVTKAMLPGAKLALYDMNDVLLKSWTSTTSSLTILGLVPGKYYIKELETPAGYNMITAKIDVTLNPAEHKNLTIYNVKQKPTQVTIVKRDLATGSVLPGAKLVLKTEAGEVISTWLSTDKGRRFTGLPEGKYTISEIVAPSGYKLLTKVYTVELVAGKAVTIDLYNEKIPEVIKPEIKITKLRVSKFDITNGQLLANAKLQIKDASGKVVAEWTSTNKEYYIEGLPAGKYTLVEIAAPTGYVLYHDAIAFELIANDIIQDVKLYNTPETIVPITDASASKLTLIIGTAVMAAGGYVVYMNMKKRNA